MPPARNVKRGFFPLDEDLALLPGRFTPALVDLIAYVGATLSFPKAREMLNKLRQIDLNKETMRRHTKQMGEAAAEVYANELLELKSKVRPSQIGSQERLFAVCIDGAMVCVRSGKYEGCNYAEVKLLSIGRVAEGIYNAKEKQWEYQTTSLTYFGGLLEVRDFEEQAVLELYRRGVEQALRVVSINDGAVWIQIMLDWLLPKAQRILDFAHAVQHINACGQKEYVQGSPEYAKWAHEMASRLKKEGVSQVLEQITLLAAKHPDDEELTKEVAYVNKRVAQMDYPRYRQEGLPIGSGSVESGHRTVMQFRLKGPGMRWAVTSVNKMLHLCLLLANQRWDQTTQALAKARYAPVLRKRQERRLVKLAKIAAAKPPPLAQTQPQEAPILAPLQGCVALKDKEESPELKEVTNVKEVTPQPQTKQQGTKPRSGHLWSKLRFGKNRKEPPTLN